MSSQIDVSISYAAARKMAIVADEASRQADNDTLSTTHKKVLEIVSRRLAEGLTPGTTASVFAVRTGETVAANLDMEVSTIQAYLETLDVIATNTPRPYVTNACQSLFSHLTEQLDVDALGLHLEEYDTMKIKTGGVFD